MNNFNNKTRTGSVISINLLGLFGIVLVVMKLAEVGKVANWSWWWVLSPFWIWPVLLVAIFMTASVLSIASVLLIRLSKWMKR